MTVVQVVEDNRDVATMLRMVLTLNRSDIEVRLVTERFRDVLDRERWEGVDIAVIDLMLPGVDGRGIIRWLAEYVPHVRRVVYTASDVQTVPDADAVISKTADFRSVFAALGI